MPATQPTVLVIDDDRIIRMVVREALATAGMDVVEAGDGDEGLERAVALRPDVIILDVMLPRVDGLTLLGQLRDHGVTSRVLVFSATGAKTAERALALGAAGYLPKPFELDDLVARVREVLDDGRHVA